MRAAIAAIKGIWHEGGDRLPFRLQRFGSEALPPEATKLMLANYS